MRVITIRQAAEADIPILEGILLDTVNWLNEMGQPLWDATEVTWDALSRRHAVGDFHIACLDGVPAGCMALIDHDPQFWPDVPKGESLILHKLAVTKSGRKLGVSDALMNYFREQGIARGVKTLRLDTHARRPKLRAFYERHGFVCVEEKVIFDRFHVAFYIYRFPRRFLQMD